MKNLSSIVQLFRSCNNDDPVKNYEKIKYLIFKTMKRLHDQENCFKLYL